MIIEKKQALAAVSLLWIGSISGAAFTFFTQVLLARGLGPSEFGVFSAALAMVTLLAPIAGFGIAGFWLKAFGKEGWQAVRWLKPSLHFVIISTVITFSILIGWSEFGPHDELTKSILFILSAHVLGCVVLELVSSKLQLEERYTSLAIWQLAPHLMRLIFVILLTAVVMDSFSIENISYVYAMVSLCLSVAGVYTLVGMKKGNLKLKGHESYGNRKALVGKINLYTVAMQAWPFGLATVFHLIYFQSDIVILKYLVGSEAAGSYSVAFFVMAGVYLLPGVIFQKFMLAKLHRWANSDRDKFYKSYLVGNRLMLFLGVMAMLLIWLFSPMVIPWLFGVAYKETVTLLMILALCAPLRFIATSVGSVLVTQEHMSRKVKYMGGVAVINVMMNFVLIPHFNAMGAAYATVLSEMILLSLYFYSANKHVFTEDEKLDSA